VIIIGNDTIRFSQGIGRSSARRICSRSRKARFTLLWSTPHPKQPPSCPLCPHVTTVSYPQWPAAAAVARVSDARVPVAATYESLSIVAEAVVLCAHGPASARRGSATAANPPTKWVRGPSTIPISAISRRGISRKLCILTRRIGATPPRYTSLCRLAECTNSNNINNTRYSDSGLDGGLAMVKYAAIKSTIVSRANDSAGGDSTALEPKRSSHLKEPLAIQLHHGNIDATVGAHGRGTVGAEWPRSCRFFPFAVECARE
jgi:hypothetical protein